MKKEITNKDLLEAMNIFAESVDKRFDEVDRKFSSFSGDMVEMISGAIKKHELRMHSI